MDLMDGSNSHDTTASIVAGILGDRFTSPKLGDNKGPRFGD
jgi:hypothetical protein